MGGKVRSAKLRIFRSIQSPDRDGGGGGDGMLRYGAHLSEAEAFIVAEEGMLRRNQENGTIAQPFQMG